MNEEDSSAICRRHMHARARNRRRSMSIFRTAAVCDDGVRWTSQVQELSRTQSIKQVHTAGRSCERGAGPFSARSLLSFDPRFFFGWAAILRASMLFCQESSNGVILLSISKERCQSIEILFYHGHFKYQRHNLPLFFPCPRCFNVRMLFGSSVHTVHSFCSVTRNLSDFALAAFPAFPPPLNCKHAREGRLARSGASNHPRNLHVRYGILPCPSMHRIPM
jgi:hypothetical protein